MKKNKGRALVTGSFDPVTRGHEDIIRRAAEEYDEVFAVVFISDEKKGFFPIEKRKEWLSAVCRKLPNVTVDAYGGFVADYAKRINAAAIVRGVRNEADVRYEQPMAEYNFLHSGVETVFLRAPEGLEGISSSAVRRALLEGKDPSALLPEEIRKEICENWRFFHQANE